jgi:ligand-binding sensor domain-containing protein
MKSIYLLLFLTFSIVLSQPAAAQQNNIHNFTTEEYNGGTQNWQVAADDKECLYFANNYGLLAFDGFRWTVSQVKNYTAVRSMYIDKKEKRIYVGASDEFGYFYYDNRTKKREYVSISDMLIPEEHDFTEIWRVHKWHNSHVFQGHYAIYIADKNDNMQIIHQHERVETSAVIGDKLYVVSREDMKIYTAKGPTQTVKLSDELRGNAIRSILEADGKILICTSSKGMFLFSDGKFSHYDTPIDKQLSEARIFSVAASGKLLAIGTVQDGLYIYNTHTKAVNHINVSSGLLNNTVLSIMFDKKNNLWLGLDNGISFIEQHSAYRRLLNVNESIGTGYASLISDSKLFLGTNQGLFTMPITADSMAYGKPSPVAGIKGQVWSLTKSDGVMLCGNDDGAFVVEGSSARKIAGSDGTWVICHLSKHPGYVIASDYKGLYVMKKVGSSYVFHSRLSNSIVSNNILEDRDGTIWVCHWQKGIYHLKVSKDMKKIVKSELFNSKHGLYVDQGNDLAKIHNTIFISSVDGFYTYDSRSRRLKKNMPLSQLFDTYDTSLKLHLTASGDIWGIKQGFLAIARRPATGSQLSDYAVDRTSFRRISNKLQIGLGKISNLNRRYTLFNSNNGFYIVDNNYENSSEKGHVYIRSIISTNTKDTLMYSDFSGSAKKIKIAHANNSLRIEFVMPEYRSRDGIRYTCFMENYDKDWSAEQTACYKEYTHLSKGHYKFHVRAYNTINGATDEALIAFDIQPAWYETNLAYLIYIGMVILALYLVYLMLKRRNERQLQQQKERQEHKLAELKSQHLEAELKHKSNELAGSTMNLVHKNDILQDIDSNMEKLSESVRREEPKKEITKKIGDIRKGIQKSLNDDNNWDKFEESFDLIYNNLMERLCNTFPDLKMNDRKLCAYLRMGLSSKEIASLMNTTTRSIETARYRLRKKLGLDQGQNLTEFIQNF